MIKKDPWFARILFAFIEFYKTLPFGQVILSSEAYNTKDACDNGIESVKKNSQNDGMFNRKEAKDGCPYFNLKASNGQVIGSSEMYSNNSAMENGIVSVKENAPKASSVDNS